MKRNYEMSQAELEELLRSFRPMPLMFLQCGTPPSRQESANAAWRRLGDRMGFRGMTVEPAEGGDRFFRAEPRERCRGFDIGDGAMSGCAWGDGTATANTPADCPTCNGSGWAP